MELTEVAFYRGLVETPRILGLHPLTFKLTVLLIGCLFMFFLMAFGTYVRSVIYSVGIGMIPAAYVTLLEGLYRDRGLIVLLVEGLFDRKEYVTHRELF